MKTNMIYLFILSLILSSCQEDKIDFAENPQEVTFLIGGSGDVETRAEGTSFDVGDKIGIYIVRHQPDNIPILQPLGNYADNKCYKVTSGANLLPNSGSDKIYTSGSGYKYSIYAYYPYRSDIIDPTNILFEIEGDQRDIKRLKNSDFMMSQFLNADLNKPVNLNFKRKFSYVHLLFNKNSEGIVPNCVGTISSYYRSKINLQTGTVEKAKHDYLSNLNAYKYAEDSKQYHYCIILPSYNFEDRAMFQVVLNDKASYYTVNGGNFPLREGGEHTINLIETQCRVTCAVKSDVGIGGTVADSEIFVKDREQCTVSAQVNDRYVFDGWFKDNVLVSTDLNYTFTVFKEDVKLEARFHVLWRLSISSNIDTNLLKPYLKGILGSGYYRNGDVAKIHTNLEPGSQYVLYALCVDGKLVTYHWDLNVQMLADHHVEAKFVRAIYDKAYTSNEFNFISNNNFEYTFNVPNVNVFFPAKTIISNKIYAYFDGEPYDMAHYATYPILKGSIHSLDGEIEWARGSIDGGHVGTAFENDSWMSVRFQLKFKYILPGNVPIRGRVHYRTYGFRSEDVPKE